MGRIFPMEIMRFWQDCKFISSTQTYYYSKSQHNDKLNKDAGGEES